MKSFETFNDLFTYLNNKFGYDWLCTDVGFDFTLKGMTGFVDGGLRLDPITEEDDETFKYCVQMAESFNSQLPRARRINVRLS